jgi:hypothetical protein
MAKFLDFRFQFGDRLLEFKEIELHGLCIVQIRQGPHSTRKYPRCPSGPGGAHASLDLLIRGYSGDLSRCR